MSKESGLRESVNDLRAWCEMQKEASGLEDTEFSAGEFLAYKRVLVHLRKILFTPEGALMANPIRLPLSPRQALALAVLLDVSRNGAELLEGPEVEALREVAEKLSTLREGR